MPRRLDPRQVAKLAQVQQVRKGATEAALRTAREVAAGALAARNRMRADVASAHDDWLGYLSTGAFEPERARNLAAHLLGREAAANAADAAHAQADTFQLRRQEDWCLSAARVQLAEARLEASRRVASRRRDERRLAELFDRMTFDWTRR